jgi:flagellar motor switch protein FliN/FliY
MSDNKESSQNQEANSNDKSMADIGSQKFEFLNDVSIGVTIEIGRTQIKLRDLLKLNKDAIIELDKLATEPVDIYANNKLIARGNIITVNGKYCVRLVSLPNNIN